MSKYSITMETWCGASVGWTVQWLRDDIDQQSIDFWRSVWR